MLSRWRRIILVLFTTLALLFLDKAGVFSGFFGLVDRFAVAPATRLGMSVGEEGVFLWRGVFGLRNIIRENIFLRGERDLFRSEYFKLLDLKAENEFLRRALNLGKAGGEKAILANIAAFDPFHAADFVLLDKGRRDGVAADDAVILSGNILVGRVKDVDDRESRALLITSGQSRATAVSEDGRVRGVVSGSASGALALDLVLKDAGLAPGQILISSGLDGVFRRGFLVGEAVKITSDSAAPFQKASVRPFFNLRDLKQVFVLVK